MHINSHISHFFLISLTIFTLVFSFTVYAKEYNVSERSFMVGGDSSFSDTHVYDFVVTGGEVIGASSPIKAYVTVEGVYEGSGSVLVYYDGDETSGEIFYLPDQGQVGNMQFVLGDKKGILDSDNAGEFNHKLYLKPQGVTISSVSVHVSTIYTRDVGNKCEEGETTSEKTKTIQSWVASGETIDGSNNYDINYGLDDDLQNINDPISSAYVEVVGLYDGGGIVEIYFNDRDVDGVKHVLQSSANQKQITLLSKDIKDLIQKQSGTDFSQNMTIETSGITLNSVSIRFVLTYRYHPMKSSCAGFPPKGEYSSPALDTRSTKGAIYNSISWRGELGGDLKDAGKVRFQLATAPCSNGSENPPSCDIGTWKYIGGATCSSDDWFESKGPNIPIDIFKTGCSKKLDGNQYYKYKLQLCAKDCIEAGKTTPFIDEVFVSWSP